MRIVCMTDNANIHTGMATVGRNIALGLHHRGYEVHYIGWFSDPNIPNKMPFPLYQTRNQAYGRDVFDQLVGQIMPDAVLTIGDKWMVDYISNWQECKTRRLFKWIGYMPIDGHALNGCMPTSWAAVIRDMDYIVAYTEYGREIMMKSAPDRSPFMIHHGVDTKIFYPLSPEERKRARQKVGIDNKFVYLVNARNQFRKNLPEICKAWKKFKAQGGADNAKLWLHCWFQDPMGWDLDEILDIYDMKKDVLYFDHVAHGTTNVKMLEEWELNLLYNCADVFLLQSGEGFGLPTIEAMATGRPCILLDHSANTEIARGRGELVKVATYMTGKYSTERPYPDLDDMAYKMRKLYDSPTLREEYGKASIEWAKERDWSNIVDKWDMLLRSVEDPFANKVRFAEVY